MKKANLELVMNVRRALEEIPVRTYEETNLKLGMMQALDQVIRAEDADCDGGGARGGDEVPARESEAR